MDLTMLNKHQQQLSFVHLIGKPTQTNIIDTQRFNYGYLTPTDSKW